MEINKQLAVEEFLDLVDADDCVIGQEKRSVIYAKKASSFRVINAFVLNKKKEVWIPRRSPHKKLFPLCLDASVGGHVAAGETYDQAFHRETLEELNIETSQVEYKFLGKLTPEKDGVSAYMYVYAIITDHAPDYNKKDFISASWYSIDALKKIIQSGEATKGDLPVLINFLSSQI
jgi:isopentenyl-diphosphate delta-isomerase